MYNFCEYSLDVTTSVHVAASLNAKITLALWLAKFSDGDEDLETAVKTIQERDEDGILRVSTSNKAFLFCTQYNYRN